MDNNGNQTAAMHSMDTVVQPWIGYWTKMFEQNSEWTQALMAGAPEKVDPATVRKQWLDTMSKSIESYMRTPAFLEAMRQNSEAMTATKVSSELAKLEMARQAGVPHVEDIHGLYTRLETANNNVLERLSAIEEQLASIEKKLGSKPKKSTGKQS